MYSADSHACGCGLNLDTVATKLRYGGEAPIPAVGHAVFAGAGLCCEALAFSCGAVNRKTAHSEPAKDRNHFNTTKHHHPWISWDWSGWPSDIPMNSRHWPTTSFGMTHPTWKNIQSQSSSENFLLIVPYQLIDKLPIFFFFHVFLNRITRINEPNMKACWSFLDQTSRSFSAVIKELDGELSRVVCIFYLVLRGLDTVEDDMSIDIQIKENLLKSFYQKLDLPGWNFDGCRSPLTAPLEIVFFISRSPTEKDRNLLVEFDKIISEFQVLDLKYRTIIIDVTARMGSGMARFARAAVEGEGVFSIDTMGAFDGYCHYVAGLVGEGLSRLFSMSGKENEELGYQLRLSNSMGLLLQKTNILRDFREDVDAGRIFWPEAIWAKFAPQPRLLTEPRYQQQARWALTEMTIDALSHAIDSLEYMTLLKNQSIFNFCAIPQVMAIATLELCFDNLDVFQKNVKIRRSLMALLISKAINPRDLSYIFVDFANRIHQRADPSDPNYLKLCMGREPLSELHYAVESAAIIFGRPDCVKHPRCACQPTAGPAPNRPPTTHGSGPEAQDGSGRPQVHPHHRFQCPRAHPCRLGHPWLLGLSCY
ncbi:farnesyl-diphosphate farnesyltransferase [Puccinia sorghi]|uniref:Squalene synthase n=1 Tax=Puccinia sorghi TaxID=27349 RepID=A0A0L6UXS9_9BASI|nr:farnesyl-diphosphate farnesyltransferase [Puccinia sorghi]